MTALSGVPVAVTVELSDEDVRRVAAAVAAEVLAIVPDWLPARPLSRADVAAWLGVAEQTLRRWECDGVLVPTHVGDVIRYTPPQLAEFFERGGIRGERDRRRCAGHEKTDARR